MIFKNYFHQWPVLLGCVLLICGVVAAEPQYDVHGDLIRPGAEEFTGIFYGAGGADEGNIVRTVVVNDSSYTIDSKTIFRTQGGGTTSLASFSNGMAVKFYALDALLTKMWPTGTVESAETAVEGKGTPEDNSNSSEEKKPASDLRKENGVWKN